MSSHDLAERRELLRSLIDQTDAEALAKLRLVTAGASEDDRRSLARTLAPTRWMRTEGGTPRAWLVLAALGTPKQIADVLRGDGSIGPGGRSPTPDTVRDFLYAGLADRPAEWKHRLVDELVAESWSVRPAVRVLLEDLLTDTVAFPAPPATETYLRFAIRAITITEGEIDGESVLAGIDGWPRFLEHSLWDMFSVEGLGSDWTLTQQGPQS